MKESQRQRAHPENAPACPICGRVCSTTWNLKQHIEKHYDIHPQKGVVKKKFEETRSATSNNSLGSNSGAAVCLDISLQKNLSSSTVDSSVGRAGDCRGLAVISRSLVRIRFDGSFFLFLKQIILEIITEYLARR